MKKGAEKVVKWGISLPADLAEFIEDEVSQAEYETNRSAVIAKGIKLLQEQKKKSTQSQSQ